MIATTLLCLMMAAVGACDILSGENRAETREAIRKRIESQQQKWDDQEIDSYRLTYSQQVGDVLSSGVEVYVSSGTVDSVRTPDNVSREDLLVGTVDSFFDLLLDRFEKAGSRFRADFNEERGFPINYEGDFNDRPSETVVTESVTERTGAESSDSPTVP